MNPLDFIFNGSQGPSAPPWFAPVTQGVSTFSSGVNPAALEASVDFGGQTMQYNLLNLLQTGSIQGVFQSLLNAAIGGLFSQLQNYLGLLVNPPITGPTAPWTGVGPQE